MTMGDGMAPRLPAPCRHVVWDWNGTLFDDAWLCVEVMDGLLRARGLPGLTAARYASLFDFPVRDYYVRLGFDFARDPFEAVGAEFIRLYEGRRLECGLQAGAREAIEAVRAAGVGQSVLSAYRHDTLGELLRHFGLRDRFDHVVGGDDIYAFGKREQGIALLRRIGVPAADVLVVGDTVHDAEVAAAMGAGCVLVPCGHQTRARLAATGARVVDSLHDLLPCLFLLSLKGGRKAARGELRS
jgi:phosphoglycolate phosphatase